MARVEVCFFFIFCDMTRVKSKSKKCLFIVDKNTTKTLVADTIKST